MNGRTQQTENKIANHPLFALHQALSKSSNETEIELYKKEPMLDKDCDPLQWWKNRAERYPLLTKLVKNIFWYQQQVQSQRELLVHLGCYLQRQDLAWQVKMSTSSFFSKINLKNNCTYYSSFCLIDITNKSVSYVSYEASIFVLQLVPFVLIGKCLLIAFISISIIVFHRGCKTPQLFSPS